MKRVVVHLVAHEFTIVNVSDKYGTDEWTDDNQDALYEEAIDKARNFYQLADWQINDDEPINEVAE